MRKHALKLAAGLLLFAGLAYGQMITERYIPIGESPGVSGKLSTIGVISNVDSGARTVTVDGASGSRTYRVDDKTYIWLDRSGWRLTNLVGSYRDCSVGQRVEIMHRRDDENAAYWIKVQARERR